MHLPDNTVLQGGRYIIKRFINSGGFGCTYEAEHTLLEKCVAIKEFFVKDFCNRDEATAHITVGTMSKKTLVEKLKRKFIDEAKALCKLQHPGIVRVFDVFEENGTAYFVMDFIDGQSLSEIVNERGPLPEAEALHYIRRVSDALKYVHAHHRLHLDIKPGNIMVSADNNTVLIDFGASKQYDEAGGENTSTLMGKTPGYAPLEQMGCDVVKFLPSTDIYALGATLYKLLMGVTPPAANMLACGESLEPLPRTISEGTRAAVAAAMLLNKNQRPQSIDEFLALLDGSAESLGVADEETVNNTNDEATIVNVMPADDEPARASADDEKTLPAAENRATAFVEPAKKSASEAEPRKEAAQALADEPSVSQERKFSSTRLVCSLAGIIFPIAFFHPLGRGDASVAVSYYSYYFIIGVLSLYFLVKEMNLFCKENNKKQDSIARFFYILLNVCTLWLCFLLETDFYWSLDGNYIYNYAFLGFIAFTLLPLGTIQLLLWDRLGIVSVLLGVFGFSILVGCTTLYAHPFAYILFLFISIQLFLLRMKAEGVSSWGQLENGISFKKTKLLYLLFAIIVFVIYPLALVL